ncbi:MAG: hypothetical protein HY558_03125 [Euryarchaeota archaeon]|nr:hypothetical protein [Euryarchaeota archaeon]
MDLEGTARRHLQRGTHPPRVERLLVEHIREIKGWSTPRARRLARAVLQEAEATRRPRDPLLRHPPAGATMGQYGVGSRGEGDTEVHRGIARIIGDTGAPVDALHGDDAGVVRTRRGGLALAVDGMHSRLSDYPLLAGFHCARASLRDIEAMGGSPLALFSDIHLADDGDIGNVFDYVAGVAAAAEATRVPYIGGSTLRIGGDLVLGDRLTGCAGAAGWVEHPKRKGDARPGDLLIMTRGSGGGTICAAALYHGEPGVVRETLNVEFHRACEALRRSGALRHIHAMTDVTNGGLRGDAHEVSRQSRTRLLLHPREVMKQVNPRVLRMLQRHHIDPLGVSIDSLLLSAAPRGADTLLRVLRRAHVPAAIIGRAEKGRGVYLETDGRRLPLPLEFREAAYTPVKKAIGQGPPPNREALRRRVARSAREARRRKEQLARLAGKR